jgi:hypothetical protein
MAFWGTTQNDDAVYRHRSMGMLAVLSKAFPWGMGMRFRTAIAMLAVLSVNEWLVVWVQTTKLGAKAPMSYFVFFPPRNHVLEFLGGDLPATCEMARVVRHPSQSGVGKECRGELAIYGV